MRDGIARLGFMLALIMLALGQVITFVPGAHADWNATASLVALAGLLFRQRRLKLSALMLAVVLAVLACTGNIGR